ncbi:MAG: 50S ribosomal protein L24 [Candidatus Woesearchaeota archaeon]
MIKMKAFSNKWIRSSQTRKQRKYRANAPLHTRQKFMRAALSKDLRKNGQRSLGLRTGDKVRIMRGQYKGKDGKVERISLREERVYITGIEMAKKDGSKTLYPIHPSNLLIESPVLDDKKRKQKVEAK